MSRCLKMAFWGKVLFNCDINIMQEMENACASGRMVLE